MQIAVFGTGIVGQVIANRLAGLGHSVTIGTRDVNDTLARTDKGPYGNPPFAEWLKENNSVQLKTFAAAASSAEIIFNCTQGHGSVEAFKLAGDHNINHKIIVDVSNPLDFSKGFPPSLSIVNTDSLGETLQRTFPETKVVKTLNTMNCFIMVNPAALPGDHTVFVSGNDTQSKSSVTEILKSFGWKENNIIDLGDITTARGTEQLLPIWVRLYAKLQNGMFNFNVVMAPPAK
jgi:predicted dinucleotide-binding enzyme